MAEFEHPLGAGIFMKPAVAPDHRLYVEVAGHARLEERCDDRWETIACGRMIDGRTFRTCSHTPIRDEPLALLRAVYYAPSLRVVTPPDVEIVATVRFSLTLSSALNDEEIRERIVDALHDEADVSIDYTRHERDPD